jgi:hypothetical protein
MRILSESHSKHCIGKTEEIAHLMPWCQKKELFCSMPSLDAFDPDPSRAQTGQANSLNTTIQPESLINF